jgi:hypothetical protein
LIAASRQCQGNNKRRGVKFQPEMSSILADVIIAARQPVRHKRMLLPQSAANALH